ncbi:cytospin-A-like isoform X2 [Zootermopsis nevadensis]|uniref:cytospin-A-like isoform X2 n=1 Tax=Zootermopsis nevadensis TaxID=136037 RepID=UPI000B8EB345|nr:cytospin-A-like isoform X2 [Zootermopsis nevadensis]
MVSAKCTICTAVMAMAVSWIAVLEFAGFGVGVLLWVAIRFAVWIAHLGFAVFCVVLDMGTAMRGASSARLKASTGSSSSLTARPAPRTTTIPCRLRGSRGKTLRVVGRTPPVSTVLRQGPVSGGGGKGGHQNGKTGPTPQQQQPLKGAGSVSSLDSKHHKVSSSSKSTGGAMLEQQELERITHEKLALEAKVAELAAYESEVMALRSEVRKLQDQRADLEQLTAENGSLRTRLHNVAHSPLSDSEKEQLLLATAVRQHSSAPASMMAAELQGDGTLADTSCSTPDWDKQSSSSLSEVSVACLQDRIMQMEETHYSTNEELQATLQELADLQVQLTELQADNERLTEEKSVLLESLCRQTEKLEDSRTKVDTLQELLLHHDQAECCTEREQKLVELLKSAQEEREVLLLKQEEMNSQLTELRQSADVQGEEAGRLTDRVRLLESTVDATHAERKQLDQELALAKEESSSRSIEISRLTTLLDNARAKIEELEQARELGDKTELDELLDNARKEKDALESQAAMLQEQLSRSQCETARLRDQVTHLQEECKVMRNNAKSAVSDLEYQCGVVRQEKQQLSAELQVLQESVAELQVQCQCHLEDKRQLKAVLSETQRHQGDVERKLAEQERALADEKRLRQEESTEWGQFQSDLLMTVRVANDFKTEAQQELEKLVLENKCLRDKLRGLEAQVEKLKASQKHPPVATSGPPVPTQFPDSSSSLLTSVQQEMAAVRRQHKAGVSRQDSRLSVKSLIESIENATKQAKAGPGSRSSSTSSLSSIASGAPPTPTSPRRRLTSEPLDAATKTPLREQQQANNQVNNNGTNSSSSGGNKLQPLRGKNALPGERKDPLSALVKNGGSKRNALLKWCQNKTIGYRNIDITNFSSSWNDGLALCAILHSYLPERVPYDSLTPSEKRRNFTIAFAAAESVGIPTTLNVTDMIQLERPDWQQVMAYVTAIYKHFET